MEINSLKLTKGQMLKMMIESKTQLNENVSSIVYHWVSPQTAWAILKSDRFSLMSTMFKSAESSLVGTSHNRMYYMSLTRNGKIGMGGYSNREGVWVRLTLDGDKLNSRFHTKALDYWGANMGKNARYTDAKTNGTKVKKPGCETESEDRLYSNKPFIDNALSYIKHIDICFDFDNVTNYNEGFLKYIYNICVNTNKQLTTLYSSVKDFNHGINPYPTNKLYDFIVDYKQQNNYISTEHRKEGHLPNDFLASIVYLVNFPFGHFEDCMKTLQNAGLGKYAKMVAKELKENKRYIYIFNLFDSYHINESNVIRILRDIYETIQISNNAQSLNREDLAKAFSILTDFCKKHKLSNYGEITKYFVDMLSEHQKSLNGDGDAKINITCAYLKSDEDSIYICPNPSTDKYKDVFPNGQDNLKWLFDDIKYSVTNHKSHSDVKFANYMRRLLINGNPTVQDIINLYHKLESLGNTIDDYYKPMLIEKEIDRWDFYSLVSRESECKIICYATDQTRLILNDKSQQKKLYDLWQKKFEKIPQK